MRKFLTTATVIGAAAFLATSPAAAQQQRYFGNQYGQHDRYDRHDGYGQRNGYQGRHFAYGKIREMQQRVAQMRQDIRHFDRIGAISGKEGRRLDKQASHLQRRIAKMGHNGLTRGEYQSARSGIRNLRAAIQRDLHDGRRWGNYGYGYQGYDRYDRDDDRWERDGRWDRDGYNRRR